MSNHINIRCDKCGGNMVARNGKYGQFLGCANFVRGCRNTMPMPKSVDVKMYNDPNKYPGWLDDFLCTTGTNEQLNIWNEFVNNDVHMMVAAGPGTGKSFTAANMIKQIANKNPYASMVYLVFGRANRADFERKARVNIKNRDYQLAQVSTLNSFGNSIIQQYYRARSESAKLDKKKTTYVVDMCIPQNDWHEDIIDGVRADVVKLVNHCKNYMFTGQIDELHYLAQRFNIDIRDEIKYVNYVQDALYRSRNFKYNSSIIYDHSDQLWLPIVLNMSFPKIDYVMCDEVQDFNCVQHHMMKRLAEGGARIMFIGDEYQSIYGFRGADTDSMNNMMNMLEDMKHTVCMPLSFTRRIPKKGVRLLNHMFAHITLNSMDDAIEGEVYRANKFNACKYIEPRDLVLSRVNAPLIGLAFKLIKSGKVAYVLGRDIADKIIKAIDNMNARSIPDLIKRTNDWRENEKIKIREIAEKNGKDIPQYAVENIDDTADCIIEIAMNVKEKFKNMIIDGKKRRANVDDVICEIQNLFKEQDDNGVPSNAVILSTVHKAKGLESDNVHIWTPDLFPHPAAKQDWEKAQEDNCKWVAYSRQKKNLYIYDSCAPIGDDDNGLKVVDI